jgi:E3 ubiquitin-protein ligase RNF144
MYNEVPLCERDDHSANGLSEHSSIDMTWLLGSLGEEAQKEEADIDAEMAMEPSLEEEATWKLIRTIAEEEKREAEDRELALAMSQTTIQPEVRAKVRTIIAENTALIIMAQPRLLPKFDGGTNTTPSSSQSGNNNKSCTPGPSSSGSNVKSREQPVRRTIQCEACTSFFFEFDTLTLSCKHIYCRECVVGIFESSIKDPELFPPRCCRTEIPFDQVDRQFLTQELSERFRKKRLEINTPNPVYCSNRTCSEFVATDYVSCSWLRCGQKATCQSCNTDTCIDCRGKDHYGDCEESEHEEILQLAKDKQWQRCPNCKTLVEITHGCNHMMHVLPFPS